MHSRPPADGHGLAAVSVSATYLVSDQIRSYYISSMASHTRLIRCLTLTWVHLLQTRIGIFGNPNLFF